MTLVYALVHSHILICLGKASLNLFKLYCSGVIFKLLKNIFPLPTYQTFTLAHSRYPYSHWRLVFVLKRNLKWKIYSFSEMEAHSLRGGISNSFKLLLPFFTPPLQYQLSILVGSVNDCITRLWQGHSHMLITPVSYCSWTPKKMVFPSLSCS